MTSLGRKGFYALAHRKTGIKKEALFIGVDILPRQIGQVKRNFTVFIAIL
jgi:hypothetical protein